MGIDKPILFYITMIFLNKNNNLIILIVTIS